MKYMALARNAGEPVVVSKSSLGSVRLSAKKIWEVPESVSEDKAKEAIKHGFEDEAGLRLIWADGRPASDEEFDSPAEVTNGDLTVLRSLCSPMSASMFWEKVRALRYDQLVGWRSLTAAVNRVTRANYSVEEVKALVTGKLVGGLPVHERVMLGPVNLTEIHRSPHIMFDVGAQYQWAGLPERVGGFVSVGLLAKDVASLIPHARRRALGYADVNGVSLAFCPSVRVGRTRMFQDQDGRRRRGRLHEVLFMVISVR